MNQTTCELNCSVIDERIPYIYEGDSILTQLFVNGSISANKFPVFSEDTWEMRITDGRSRDFSFFISAKYDFQNRMWNSGGFEVVEKYWAERNLDEKTYPILDDRLLLVQNDHQWVGTDHWGTVDCKNHLFSSFKV